MFQFVEKEEGFCCSQMVIGGHQAGHFSCTPTPWMKGEFVFSVFAVAMSLVGVIGFPALGWIPGVFS